VYLLIFEYTLKIDVVLYGFLNCLLLYCQCTMGWTTLKQLRMLLVCIRSYLKSVLRYKFLILDTYHPDTLYLGKDMSIHGYLSKSKGVRDQKILVSRGLKHSALTCIIQGIYNGLHFTCSTYLRRKVVAGRCRAT
jgi:hypothetical protein